MATDKRAITAYLPDDIEEKLIKYCTEYNITRKDKEGNDQPSLGTGIVDLLKIILNKDTVPSPLESNVSIDIEALEQNITDNLLGKLPEYIDSNVKSKLLDTKALEDNLKRYIDSTILDTVPDIFKSDIENAIAPIKQEIQQLKKPSPSYLIR